MMNATEAIVAVGKLTGTVASPTDDRAERRADERVPDHAWDDHSADQPDRQGHDQVHGEDDEGARARGVLTAIASSGGNSAKACRARSCSGGSDGTPTQERPESRLRWDSGLSGAVTTASDGPAVDRPPGSGRHASVSSPR